MNYKILPEDREACRMILTHAGNADPNRALHCNTVAIGISQEQLDRLRRLKLVNRGDTPMARLSGLGLAQARRAQQTFEKVNP